MAMTKMSDRYRKIYIKYLTFRKNFPNYLQ